MPAMSLLFDTIRHSTDTPSIPLDYTVAKTTKGVAQSDFFSAG
jgi:hypothetical protein